MALIEDDDFSTTDAASLNSSWVTQIEDVVEHAADEWGLHIGNQLQAGMNGYLVEVTLNDGSPAVLKVRRPDDAMRHEAAALRLFDGKGSVALRKCNEELGALLLDRIEPGNQATGSSAGGHPDDIMPHVIKALSNTVPDDSLQPLAERAERWAWNLARYDERTPLDSTDLKNAAKAFNRLAGTQDTSVVLHGDLHIGNVLQCGDGATQQWIAIDPKGFSGEAQFESAWWLRDPPVSDGPIAPALASRLAKLEEHLPVDRERVLEWAESCAILLAAARVAAFMWWDAERHADCALALRSLR